LKVFQEWRERRMKENRSGSEFKYYIFDTRTFVNDTMYTHQHNNKINKVYLSLTFSVLYPDLCVKSP
jgi:hypothetical protein